MLTLSHSDLFCYWGSSERETEMKTIVRERRGSSEKGELV